MVEGAKIVRRELTGMAELIKAVWTRNDSPVKHHVTERQASGAHRHWPSAEGASVALPTAMPNLTEIALLITDGQESRLCARSTDEAKKDAILGHQPAGN
jgi:hypothetical protein